MGEWTVPAELEPSVDALNEAQRAFITSGAAIDIIPERQLLHELETRDTRGMAKLLDDLMAVAEQMGYSPARDMGAAPLKENLAAAILLRARWPELARQGIEAGALGFSTSRTRNHKTSTGAYTPTLTAAPDELIGIAQGVGATGTGVLQVVSDFLEQAEKGVLEGFDDNNWIRQAEAMLDHDVSASFAGSGSGRAAGSADTSASRTASRPVTVHFQS